jgi:arginine:agmatine antiporter
VIENPSRNVPLATLIGLRRRGRVHVELHRDHGNAAERAAADVRRSVRRRRADAFGTAGAIAISVCAVLKSLGSLGGWMLLVGQSAKAAADGCFRARALEPPRRARRRAADHRRALTIMLFATQSPTLAASSTISSISRSFS